MAMQTKSKSKSTTTKKRAPQKKTLRNKRTILLNKWSVVPVVLAVAVVGYLAVNFTRAANTVCTRNVTNSKTNGTPAAESCEAVSYGGATYFIGSVPQNASAFCFNAENNSATPVNVFGSVREGTKNVSLTSPLRRVAQPGRFVTCAGISRPTGSISANPSGGDTSFMPDWSSSRFVLTVHTSKLSFSQNPYESDPLDDTMSLVFKKGNWQCKSDEVVVRCSDEFTGAVEPQ